MSTARWCCNVCERKFPNRSNLRRHKLIHAGKKPLNCEHCDKNFRQSGNLKTHIKAHHPTSIYMPKGRKHQSKKVGKMPIESGFISLPNDRAIAEKSISIKIKSPTFSNSNRSNSNNNITLSFWKTESKCDNNMLPFFGQKKCAKCCYDFMPHTCTGKYDIFASICSDCTYLEQLSDAQHLELISELDELIQNS
jgi:hypothetical protein